MWMRGKSDAFTAPCVHEQYPARPFGSEESGLLVRPSVNWSFLVKGYGINTSVPDLHQLCGPAAVITTSRYQPLFYLGTKMLQTKEGTDVNLIFLLYRPLDKGSSRSANFIVLCAMLAGYGQQQTTARGTMSPPAEPFNFSTRRCRFPSLRDCLQDRGTLHSSNSLGYGVRFQE